MKILKSKNNLYTECAYKIQTCNISTKVSLRTFAAMPAVLHIFTQLFKISFTARELLMDNGKEQRRISVIIPNYNMGHTIGLCLEAAFASDYSNFEVIVVDDCSDDDSLEIISRYPCKLIQFEKRSGTSAARNAGARHADGEILFFIDADCLLQTNSLAMANEAYARSGPDCILGGTYTEKPYDDVFFSRFQSVTVNFAEKKMGSSADYIAAHAMILSRETFCRFGGFPEDFLPIIEDVEFSHRLKRRGCRLMMVPGLEVRHIFNFDLASSLRNAFRKSMYWTVYSMSNRDLLKDSGAASSELKVNVAVNACIAVLLLVWFLTGSTASVAGIAMLVVLNLHNSRHLIKAFHAAGGIRFTLPATAYFLTLYPVPVGLGTAFGIARHLMGLRCGSYRADMPAIRCGEHLHESKKEVSPSITGQIKRKEIPERL
jgi:glycosyltransferase involved in cell wall biosynthesis